MEVREAFTQDDGDYKKINPTWHVEDSAWKAGQVLKLFERNQIKPGSIAEIGCGAGEILNQLHQRMEDKTIEFTGYEIAPDAFILCLERQRERLTFFSDDPFSNDKHFDLVMAIDVFEHVDDFMGFIRATAKKANYKVYHIPLDISIYAILINNFKYVRTPGGHIHYFNKFTALETLKDCGLEVIDFFYTPGVLELNQKNLTLFTRTLNLVRRMFYKISPNFAVNLFGGYSLMVIAK